MRGIVTEFLDFDENVISQILDKYEIEKIGAWVRFWSNEEIQIDGNLSLKEMQALTKVMQAVNPANNNFVADRTTNAPEDKFTGGG